MEFLDLRPKPEILSYNEWQLQLHSIFGFFYATLHEARATTTSIAKMNWPLSPDFGPENTIAGWFWGLKNIGMRL